MIDELLKEIFNLWKPSERFERLEFLGKSNKILLMWIVPISLICLGLVTSTIIHSAYLGFVPLGFLVFYINKKCWKGKI